MTAVLACSIIAALISAASQIQYIGYVVRKKILLNKATWGLSALVMVLQAGTYLEVIKGGNAWIAAATIVVAVSFIFIFLYSFATSRYATFSRIDMVAFILALLALSVWKLAGTASYAHLILQVSILVSWMPTIIGLFMGRLREKPLPWFISASSYVFVIAALYLDSGFTNPLAYAYPLVIGLGLNCFIGLQALAQDFGTLPKPALT